MKQLEKLVKMFESFHEAIYIVDKHRKILYFNPVATQISGFSQGETEGFFCYDNILNHVDQYGKNLCFEGCPLVDSIKYNRVEDHMVYLHHKEGHRIKVHVRAIPYIEDDKVVGAIEVFTDETQKNLMKDELAVKDKLLMIDPLTGLYNRRFLENMLSDKYHHEQQIGLLFFDIDNFKAINDVFGHLYGDDVLKSVSKTISMNLKSEDVVIRFGGEEIVAIIKNLGKEKLLEVAETLRLLIHQTKPRTPEHDYLMSASIGVTMLQENEALIDAIHRADLAMYQAKKAGKDTVVYK